MRICQRCGRGRAELVAGDGTGMTIPLDAARAQELAARDDAPDVPWLSSLVLGLLGGRGGRIREVVIDVTGTALRALVTLAQAGENDVVACTAQEGVGLALRATAPLYATDEALAVAVKPEAGGRETVH